MFVKCRNLLQLRDNVLCLKVFVTIEIVKIDLLLRSAVILAIRIIRIILRVELIPASYFLICLKPILYHFLVYLRLLLKVNFHLL